MANELEQTLTSGLLGGYAGAKSRDIKRGMFSGKGSSYEGIYGDYDDQWFVPDHVGGGQELVSYDDQAITRVYAGGTPPPEKLADLGLTPKDVSRYLKRKILELGDKTRLYQSCFPDPDGDWQYEYKILRRYPEVGVVVGAESIRYQVIHLVHIHPFIISPMA